MTTPSQPSRPTPSQPCPPCPPCPHCPVPLGDGERVSYGMHLRCKRKRARR